jgi:hypothetical protein
MRAPTASWLQQRAQSFLKFAAEVSVHAAR